MTKTLLFELGCEDLPALQMDMAIDTLRKGFAQGVADARIRIGHIQSYVTPRRLTLIVSDVAARQEDLHDLKVGPAMQAARDADGNLTRAAQGFLRSVGADESAIEEVIQEKKKGRPEAYMAVRIHKTGAASSTLLPGILVSALQSIHWKKPMRWGSGSTFFARPVHWIVAVLDDNILDLRFAGVQASNQTVGHRFMSPEAITLTGQSDYLALMRKVHVLADPVERRERTLALATQAAHSVGGQLVENEKLLDEVVHILEWPVGIVGEIDEAFLALPREVLETSMVTHQRYFSVVDAEGSLLPYFVTLSNTDVTDKKLVARGNERVLRARLKDAEFFFEEDQKLPLADYAPKLSDVRYVEGMGSIGTRVERMRHLASKIAALWQADDVNFHAIDRAAELCKADLVTGMVGEFPELQGIMGGIYAAASGDSAEVALAIREHYEPKQSGGAVAQSTTGVIVAIAEKLDAIVSLISLGRIPTGTADPFALRRAAIGVLRSLAEHGQSLSIIPLIGEAIDAVYASRAMHEEEADFKLLPHAEILTLVTEFITTRLRHWLSERYPSEVVDAVVAQSELGDIPAIIGRIEALQAQREKPQFAELIAIFKRVSNILRPAGLASIAIDATLFEMEEERQFFHSIEEVEGLYLGALREKSYVEALTLLTQLKDSADAFFDEVLVNSPDEGLRRNRFALLQRVEGLFLQFADVRRL